MWSNVRNMLTTAKAGKINLAIGNSGDVVSHIGAISRYGITIPRSC